MGERDNAYGGEQVTWVIVCRTVARERVRVSRYGDFDEARAPPFKFKLRAHRVRSPIVSLFPLFRWLRIVRCGLTAPTLNPTMSSCGRACALILILLDHFFLLFLRTIPSLDGTLLFPCCFSFLFCFFFSSSSYFFLSFLFRLCFCFSHRLSFSFSFRLFPSPRTIN